MIERLSLWRELQIAQILVIKSVLDTFSCLSLFKSIYKLPVVCSDSRRQRIPRLCIFRAYPGKRPGWTGIRFRQIITAQANSTRAR
jgi:hypothetical protein